MRLISRRIRRGARDQRGAVAIIVAVSMVLLLIVTAMVLDFGLVRLNRQQAKSAADSAAMAGIRAGDGGSDVFHTFLGVCGALQYLKSSDPELSTLPLGATCTAPDAAATCDPSNPDNPDDKAVYTESVSSGGLTSQVTIKSPYDLSDGGFPEEAYGSLSADISQLNGCDQVGVIITQSRKPGLGSLATSSDLRLRIRSVARVHVGDGDLAPALLLLERTRCQVLTNGNNSASNTSKIWVEAGDNDTPASIHSDSQATDGGCGSGPNQQLLAGNKDNGIVAFGTPAGDPGIISTYATLAGRAPGIVSDGLAKIFGTTASGSSDLPGTKPPLAGRDRVGRLIADQHYLAGVTTMVRDAYLKWGLDHATPTGWTRFGCSPDMSVLGGASAPTSVYIDCPGNSGITLDGTIKAQRVYFHGFIKGGKLSLPNATEVYIDNTDDSGAKVKSTALNLGNNDKFCMRGSTCVDYGTDTCSSAATGSSEHGRLMVRRGFLNSTTGGLLRMCNTTVVMEGGQLGTGTALSPGGCLPTTNGTLPTATPCTGASDPAGSGYFQLAGATDWTAPNRYGDMSALSETDKQAAWDSGEDLALWDETYAVSPNFKMAGGAELNVSGVFFVPNAFPMVFSGGAVFDLRDAQFITRSFAVDGGAQLLMKVDPYNAITIPKFDRWTLIR